VSSFSININSASLLLFHLSGTFRKEFLVLWDVRSHCETRCFRKLTDWVLNCYLYSTAQRFLVPSPTGLMTAFYCPLAYLNNISNAVRTSKKTGAEIAQLVWRLTGRPGGIGVRFPVGARIFSSPYRPDRFWVPTSLVSNGYRGSFPGD
jgi:hypothetical protein